MKSIEARESERQEALSYPVAFWGFVLSFAFMVGWSTAAGIRFDVALALWISYLVISMLWFSIFVGWLCKVLITRFGGTETYRNTTPMFLGLALGDVTMMLVWLAVDAWQGRVYHQLMPG